MYIDVGCFLAQKQNNHRPSEIPALNSEPLPNEERTPEKFLVTFS